MESKIKRMEERTNTHLRANAEENHGTIFKKGFQEAHSNTILK